MSQTFDISNYGLSQTKKLKFEIKQVYSIRFQRNSEEKVEDSVPWILFNELFKGASDLGFCALTASEHIDDQLDLANQISDQPDTRGSDFNLELLMKKCQHITGLVKLKLIVFSFKVQLINFDWINSSFKHIWFN